jgi:hypothetical protein
MRRRTWSNSLASLAAAALLMIASLGCGGLAEKIKTAANSGSNTSANGPSTTPFQPKKPADGQKLYESQAQLDEFISALTAAVGSDNPNVLKVTVYDLYAMVEVQDPKKPENIDGYTWRDGKLSQPNPVRIIGNGKIGDNVFPLKDVNFAGLPDLTKEIGEKLKDVEGGSMIGYTISRGLPFSKDVRILGLTNSTRKSVSTEADKNAKLKKFEVR